MPTKRSPQLAKDSVSTILHRLPAGREARQSGYAPTLFVGVSLTMRSTAGVGQCAALDH